ncbi:MAG: 3'-5' exonuclease [Alphaproteobacteria bacterium]|nr:3'-5' exonuclease [Alphaproteobacteria bacterium]
MAPTLYLDVETTGLDSGHEIVEAAVINNDGHVLLDTLCAPGPLHWIEDEARAVHGITDDMLVGQRPVAEVKAEILDLCRGREVVIYNAAFELGFLPDLALATGAAKIHCAMKAFAELNGEWSDYHGDWRWQTLAVAARRAGHVWRGAGHRAVHDAYATRAVWHWCLANRERIRDERLQQQADAALLEWERMHRVVGVLPAWVETLAAKAQHTGAGGCVCRRCLQKDADAAFGDDLRARHRDKATAKREAAYQSLLDRLQAGEQIEFGVRWPSDFLMTTTDAKKALGAHPEALGLVPRAWGVTNQHTGGRRPLWCRVEIERKGAAK